MVQYETDKGSGWYLASGLIVLYLKSIPLKGGFFLKDQEGDKDGKGPRKNDSIILSLYPEQGLSSICM